MFASALRQVERFTHPVIISTRYFSGKVEAGCGAFVILNAEGWILTASHIMEPLFLARQHRQEIAEYEQEKARIESDRQLSAKQKKRELARLRPNPRWITNLSHWWGRDGVVVQDIVGDQIRDIAVARLDPFDPAHITCYPTFWNPDDALPTGTSLCRLGFPFHDVTATFDSATNCFTLAPGTLPVPRFPLDGIHTRVAVLQDEASGRTTEFIEVSTPGLRGQSGGPVFDITGKVCGIQCRTNHLPLGFSPKVERGGREVVEHQFLNVGLATHVKEIVAFLRDRGITVDIAPRDPGQGA